MSAPAPTEKEKSLIRLYQRMETDEIERRLAGGQLADLAAVVARVELNNRKGKDWKAPAGPGESVLFVVLMAITATVLTGLLAYVLMSKEMFFLVIVVVVLPAVAGVIGKLLPKLGLFVGGVLMATPVWLGGLMWHAGALQWKTGDFAPLGSILAYVALFVVSLTAMGLGGAMIGGALHEGSWTEYAEELETQRQKGLDAVKKVRHP